MLKFRNCSDAMSGRVINITESDGGWQDVVLPNGALKTGKLTGLIGFEEFIPKEVKPTKNGAKKTQKRKRAEILFGEAEVPKTSKNPKVDKVLPKKVKKDAPKSQKPKKVQKSSKREKFELSDAEKSVSNYDYKFCQNMSSWTKFNLAKSLLRGIDTLTLAQPSEIQAKTIPNGLNTKSTILAAAETGSGKTYAYALPILHKIIGHLEKYGRGDKAENAAKINIENDENSIAAFENMDDAGMDGPLALILCPTRELAVQVHDAIRRISKFTDVRTAAIVGGISQQKQGLKFAARKIIVK